jgi:hypothetical protein
MQVLLRLLTAAEWHPLWTELAVRVESFASLGVSANTPDATLWQLCQTQQIILITGNRNEEGPASLEATIQASNTPTSLPVLTISEPQRILSSRAYARRVVERLLEYLIDVENLRGTGRFYLP